MIKTETKKQSESVLSFTNTLGSVAKGVVVSYIFLVLAFAALALVYTYTDMSDKFLTPAVYIISAISLFGAGFVSSAKAKVHGWLHGALAGVMYALARLGLGVAVFKSYVPSAGILETLLVSVVLAVLGGIFGVNVHRKAPHKRKRRK